MTNSDMMTVVASCDARTCQHNQASKCTAGQIEVSFAGSKAECLTFAPESSSGASMGKSVSQ